jgi:Ala-tRNA(Pro) deacylase
LEAESIQYDVIVHEPTMSSTRTAEACRISGNCLAKGIVLRRGSSDYVLAVLPASHHIHLADLRKQLGDDIQMAKEAEIDPLFPDCAHGAVPAVGQCYGLPLVIDDNLETLPQVYMEAGDHQTLIRMDHSHFAHLTAGAPHARFSEKLPAGPSAWIHSG